MTVGVADDDRGLLLGDGLFETLLVDRGTPLALDAHRERLARGSMTLGLPAPGARPFMAAVRTAVAAAGLGEARAAVRVNWTAGAGGRGLDRPDSLSPRLWASASPAPQNLPPARLITAQVRRNDGSPTSRLKTLAYLDNVLARAEARALGADEALMLNSRGEIACAAAANLFWIAQDQLFTPALECGVLDGTVRAVVLALASQLGVPAREVRAERAALEAAQAVFLTNSLIGLRPVSYLDGRALVVHPLVTKLSALWEASLASSS